MLSPYIAGKTLYLYLLLPFADPGFWRYVFRELHIGRPELAACALLFAVTAMHLDVMLIARLVTTLLCVVYIIYTMRFDGLSLLYLYLGVNVAIALAQFVLVFVNPEWANMIGPAHIAELVWGQFATPTFTNFFAIFLFPRVSGLSREAGFFGALISVALALIVMTPRQHRPTRWTVAILLLGYVLSFSKISFGLPIFLVIYRLRRYLGGVPLSVTVLAVFFILCTALSQLWRDQAISMEHGGSVVHRASGYIFLTHQSDLTDFLWGREGPQIAREDHDDQVVRDVLVISGPSEYMFPGLSGLVVNYGVLFLAGLLFALRGLGMRSAGFLYLFVLTINVTIITTTSFVVLAYLVALDIPRRVELRRFQAGAYNDGLGVPA